jgi:formate hydrogenlyase transcriptional activator
MRERVQHAKRSFDSEFAMETPAEFSDKSPAAIHDDAVLRAIAEGVEAETADRFFSSLARHLALALEVQYAFVSHLSDDGTRFKILALWERDHFGPNLEIPLTGTPCESVLHGESAHYSTDLCARFPDDRVLAEWGAQSYCGVPVLDAKGGIFGHVAILDDKPMPDGSRGIAVMRIFATRVRAEVERLRMEGFLREANQQLAQTERENARLAESEKEYRTILDAIPLLITALTPDGHYVYANQAVIDYSGLKREDLKEYFRSRVFHPDDIERVRAARRRGLAEGVPFQIEQRAGRKDGQYRWYLVQYRPVHDEHGKLVRWYATGTDIDDQKQVELRLVDQNAYLLDELRTEQNFGDMVGGSSGLRKVMRQVQLVAPTDATVLITGESGTGKELIARAIHDQGSRSDRSQIKLNCSAVPEGLFESEFFGHVRGAFTGALKDKPGRFELADGGTLFLDEIGEVPLAMQAKLLRVLQEQELERVGDTRTRKVNVRVIAASNRDLKKEVEEGRFREDLFYRLGVFPIEVPPLRERRDDIAPLVAHFVRQSARRMNRPEPQISKSALDQLADYHWPGNVRELQNTVERAIILWREGPLTFDLPAPRPQEHIVEQPNSDVKVRLPTRDEAKRLEREAIINALKQTNGIVSGPSGAARLLGLKPSTVASRISALGIKRRTEN